MSRVNNNCFRLTSILAALITATTLTLNAVHALPPAPANDAIANAEDLGSTFPTLIYGSSVLGDNSVNDSGGALAAIDSFMDGPDVFYKFTTNGAGTYRIRLAPWQRAPLRSSDRRFVLYMFDTPGGPLNFIDGIRAPGNAQPVTLDVVLNAATEYHLGVDHDNATHDNFDFQLIVEELNLTNPDNCASAMVLPTALPVVVVNDIDGAADDFAFTQSTGQCEVAVSTTAPGIDHVYSFTPTVTDTYAIELYSTGFPDVLYIDDSCDPFFLDGCQGASHVSTSAGGKHELIAVELMGGTEYFIFVDNNSTTNVSGNYALIIDTAFNYEISELEPNDTPATANPIGTPLNGGQLIGRMDEDWWSVTGNTGDRVYAWANNGGSSNSTLDTDLGFFAADGSTLIEFDDEDADGANAPIGDLRFIYSTTAPVIAGAKMTSNGTHYFRVTDQSSTGTVHRYRFHTGVQPASRSPQQECEPNNSIASADRTGRNYFAGVIPTSDDRDFYAFEATVGDRVFIACDGDPERDAAGNVTANSDPNAFHAKLIVYDPAGDILISDISDSNSIQSAPDYPAQGGFFVARTTGTHYVEVTAQSASSQVGPTETYELAVFLNEERGGAGTEDVDPIVILTPDFANNTIGGSVTDNAVGDTGICSVTLIDNDNLQINNLSALPAATATFDIDLVNTLLSGTAKLLVTDCAGNTVCNIVSIDIDAPICDGFNFSNRSPMSMHDPLHVPNNDLTGINGTIEIADAGLITNVRVTVNVLDAIDTGDLDIFLISPSNTSVELVTDRMSSLAIDMRDTTFDDDADEIVPFLSSAAPFTGSFLPEDPGGLTQLDGEQAQGTWSLNVIDDSSSADFGATLVKWSLDIDATFAGPETFAGTVTDVEGISSIVLSGATNLQLNFPNGFTPGDQVVEYTVTLIDDTMNGSGTITATDLQDNTCQSAVSLNGLADGTPPANTGSATTELTFGAEVQQVVDENDPAGVVSTINVPDSFLVGEVEVALMVDSDNQGRIAAKLTHGGEFASLVNRIGMEDRGASGNTKNSFDIILDDDAPQADDIHEEPPLGTIETLGLHQPDGRGEFFGDGISTDNRDNMLFKLAGLDSAGDWDLLVADTRMISTSDNIFRRWSMTLKNPCGPERYVGTAKDIAPGSGICTIALAGGATNLQVVASFTPGDEVVDYRVELVDISLPGSGTLEITDCAGNTNSVPINLAAASGDNNLPLSSGSVNGVTDEFEGTASDNQAGDTGIASIILAPWSDNLQITSVSALPAATATYTVGLVNPAANGRGYVRVTDACGLRQHVLVEIDAQDPVCTGIVGNTKRFFSGDVSQAIPDNNAAGVTSDIVVTESGTISDVDITFNITHPFDGDIDMTLTSPLNITLMTDIGSTGNDFIDTTLDDEATAPIPSGSSNAPYTGSFQPEGGPALLALDGSTVTGTYTLRVVDDKTNDTGTFNNWSIKIESASFPESFDGRAEDNTPNDSGICTVELLAGADNLALTVDPVFAPGDPIVRYTVDLVDPLFDGSGTVRVTDCVGNVCDQPVALQGVCTKADYDNDTDIDGDDFAIFLAAFATVNAAVDLDGDGLVSLVDYQIWLLCYQDFIGSPSATPPVPGNAGDINLDGSVDGLDIQEFVDVAVEPEEASFAQKFLADMNGDAEVNITDMRIFVGTLR